MCLDADGTALFATAEAHKMCALWNRGLEKGGAFWQSRPDLELPGGTGNLLLAAYNNGYDARTSGVRVRHPHIPELSVTIHMDSPAPATASGPHFMLMFVVDAALRTTGEEASEAEQTLRQLTPSERRVALLVAEGLRNEDIAQRLQRSRRTIEYQLNAIFRKLDMSRRTQLVRVLV
jgi:DNA-binding CsgD family transcriptional regulator